MNHMTKKEIAFPIAAVFSTLNVLVWLISMGVTAGLHLNNQWTVGSSAVIVKKDDGSATGCYVAVDASDVDELDAIWEKSGEILKSIEE